MLILREEKFGGIVFNDENAIQLSLDKEGFSIFKKYVRNFKNKFSIEEKKFINEVSRILELNNGFKVKIIESCDSKDSEYSFEILSSPTLADIQITTKCNLHCPHCYAESSSEGKNIGWEDLNLALDVFEKEGIFQVALGGGEPTLHPRFIEIIETVRKRGMVPNLTTNGKELTAEVAGAMGRYCGAIALSIEGLGKEFERRRNFSWKKFCQSAELLKECGNKLVFQITVSDSNIEKLPRLVDSLLDFQPYGIILLAYKPVGRGKFFDDVLAVKKNDSVKKILKKCLDKVEGKTRIGFDCCFAQGIIEMAKEILPFNFKVVEGCSALRNSLAITKDLDVVPCSFIDYTVGNLRYQSLSDVWFGERADEFRKKIDINIKKQPCAECLLKNQCLGGCPEFNLVKCSKIDS
jgi:radical SAM protein with 4Fe4S-binding SPASM domain